MLTTCPSEQPYTFLPSTCITFALIIRSYHSLLSFALIRGGRLENTVAAATSVEGQAEAEDRAEKMPALLALITSWMTSPILRTPLFLAVPSSLRPMMVKGPVLKGLGRTNCNPMPAGTPKGACGLRMTRTALRSSSPAAIARQVPREQSTLLEALI
jgi:hypothetical protein